MKENQNVWGELSKKSGAPDSTISEKVDFLCFARIFDEDEEIELTTQLLEVTNETELDHFISEAEEMELANELLSITSEA